MRTTSIASLAALTIATVAFADGPGAYRPPERALDAPVHEQQANDAYNAGYALVERADRSQALADAAANDEQRRAELRSAQSVYRASLERFKEAVRLNPSMHEAHTYLGYAHRKLGRYEQALQAYEQALHIKPDNPYAIEYQGEAFLGLNRVDAAKFNYLRLYALDRTQARKLLRAMRAWAEANAAAAPAGVDVAALKSWIADRERSHDADKAASSSW